MAREYDVIVKKTGKKTKIKDFGAKFHPRFWDKKSGYDLSELKFIKMKLKNVV